MAPINQEIKFITADNYPKAKAINSQAASKPQVSAKSESAVDTYSPNGTSGKDPQILNMRRAAQESGRTATFGRNGGKGDPTGLPKGWGHSVQADGTHAYRNGILDESAYRPKVTARKKKRNAPSPTKAETKKNPEPPPKKTSTRGWKPEAIPKYRVLPKEPVSPPAAKAAYHKGSCDVVK